MTEHTALVVGATGLVGNELVKLLLSKDYYQNVKVLTRRELAVKSNRLETIIVDDFDKLDQFRDKLKADDYYCTLGTTIKRAGSKPAFEKVDLVYPLKLAEIAAGFEEFSQFLVVTAAGSKAKSPLFYNQVKGRLEEDLMKMDLPALKIFRPSLLLGHRQEVRLGEQVGKIVTGILTFFMVGSRKALLSIKGSDVAKGMFYVATQRRSGTEIFTSPRIYKLAKSLK